MAYGPDVERQLRFLEFTQSREVRDPTMSSIGILASLPEDHFQCSICLNVFSNPVTTPCGHNFCKTCLSEHWDSSEVCHCPTCNKRFYMRPEISTNSVIEEISVQIKRRKVETIESTEAPWQVKCDVCTEPKLKARKSCLGCLTSYCEAHLEPHHRVPSLMRHKLIDPVESLEERVCEKHERILELFCRNEQVCICLLCNEMDHKDHDTVTVEEEATRQKVNIEAKNEKIKTMIAERTDKIKEFTAASEVSRERAKKEIDDSEKLFSVLMTHVQDMQIKLKSNIQKKLSKSQEKDEAVIRGLHEEIADLQRKQSEVEELALNDDHLQFLKTLKALDILAEAKDWSKIKVYPDLCVQTVRRAMSHLVDTFKAELRTVTNTELTRMRKYKASFTFDQTTAGCGLRVTQFGYLRHYKNASPSSSDHESFDFPMILGTQGFTSGRHYWEVQVGLKSQWDVGVAKETVNRTGRVPLKKENGFFAIKKRGLDYEVHSTPHMTLHLCPMLRNIGVFLDYEGGRVSFYDVDEKLHIYSFTGESFTGKLFPYFYLYSRAKKSEALVIHNLNIFSFAALKKQE